MGAVHSFRNAFCWDPQQTVHKGGKNHKQGLKSALRTNHRRLCHKRRVATPSKRITFAGAVSVTEFARRLDGGGTIPGDGSKVTLGLGKPLKRTTVTLPGDRHKGGKPIEERAWLPTEQRIRLLRAAMGDARYFKAWVQHRKDWHQICNSRREENTHFQDRAYMPSSLAEAKQRAKALAKETSCWRPRQVKLLQRVPGDRVQRRHRAPAKAGVKKTGASGLRSGVAKRAKKVAAPKPAVRSGGKSPLDGKPLPSKPAASSTSPAEMAASPSAAADALLLAVGAVICHRCSRPIAAADVASRCTCLQSSSCPPETAAVAL
mmetsp:Transcript_61020/g.145398  ORF Transcript_61020/g.145398 Transcript_61020/m.145398 type:complete len:319 (-) Transcript_61020:22-978(-)